MWLDYIKSFLLYQRFMSNAQWCIIKAWCFYCIEETEIRLREDVSLEILWHNDEERGNTQRFKNLKRLPLSLLINIEAYMGWNPYGWERMIRRKLYVEQYLHRIWRHSNSYQQMWKKILTNTKLESLQGLCLNNMTKLILK